VGNLIEVALQVNGSNYQLFRVWSAGTHSFVWTLALNADDVLTLVSTNQAAGLLFMVELIR
jgi:hypothetical protein